MDWPSAQKLSTIIWQLYFRCSKGISECCTSLLQFSQCWSAFAEVVFYDFYVSLLLLIFLERLQEKKENDAGMSRKMYFFLLRFFLIWAIFWNHCLICYNIASALEGKVLPTGSQGKSQGRCISMWGMMGWVMKPVSILLPHGHYLQLSKEGQLY